MRRWKWLVIVVSGLLLLCWATYKLLPTSPTNQLEQTLQKLRQSGEPTTLSDLLPPVPAQKDGTFFYQLAITQLEMAQKRLPKQVWESIYEFIGRQSTKPFNPADVQKALQAAQPALKTLRKALEFPHMRLTDWEVENPMAVMFPHFSKFREFARLLVAEGKWRKQKGDVDGAVESHMAILKLVRRMGDEPSLLIGFLVQSAIYSIAFRGLEQVLSDADPSPQTYRALMAELRLWDIDRDFVRALQSERVLTIATCKWMQEKASRKMLNRLLLGDHPFSVNLTLLLKPRSTLIAQNALKVLKHENEALVIASKGAPYDWEAVKRLEEQMKREIDTPAMRVNLSGVELIWDENAIAKLITPFLSPIFARAASIHAMQRIAQTAVASRLYRHENGRYPETLNELVPKYLPKVPIDPFDGKPLRYKRLKHGFKIWSVGENMKDDGGVEGKLRREEGDIVWEAKK